MDTVSKIFILLERSGSEQKDFAKAIGVRKQAVTEWKNGTTKSYGRYISKIADYFGVTTDYLLGSDDQIKKPSSINDNVPSGLTRINNTGYIPILGQIPAGLSALALEEVEGYTAVDVHNPEECFALRVRGDSMINAGICPGDLVIIRTQHCAENGQIVACRVNGDEATLKRYKLQGETVILLPENPNYDPIIVPCSEFDNGYASIIGVAIGMQRSFL